MADPKEEPNELEDLNVIYELLQAHDVKTRRRMLSWLRAKFGDEREVKK